MTTHTSTAVPRPLEAARVAPRPAVQAFWILRVGFAALPILAGLDKFAHILVDWEKYLAPAIDRLFGGSGHQLMMVAGVIEVIAGIGVAIWPRVFAYVVAAWLLGIVVNLLLIPGYYDIALRDLALATGAVALARLAAPPRAIRVLRPVP